MRVEGMGTEFSPGIAREKVDTRKTGTQRLYETLARETVQITDAFKEDPQAELPRTQFSQNMVERVDNELRHTQDNVNEFLTSAGGEEISNLGTENDIMLAHVKDDTDQDSARNLAFRKNIAQQVFHSVNEPGGLDRPKESQDDPVPHVEIWGDGATLALRYDLRKEGSQDHIAKLLGIELVDNTGIIIPDPQILAEELSNLGGFTLEPNELSPQMKSIFKSGIVILFGDDPQAREHEREESIQTLFDAEMQGYIQESSGTAQEIPPRNLNPRKVSEMLSLDDDTFAVKYGQSKDEFRQLLESLEVSQIAWSVVTKVTSEMSSILATSSDPVSEISSKSLADLGMTPGDQLAEPQVLNEQDTQLIEKIRRGYIEAAHLSDAIRRKLISEISSSEQSQESFRQKAALLRAYTVNPVEYLLHHDPEGDWYRKHQNTLESVMTMISNQICSTSQYLECDAFNQTILGEDVNAEDSSIYIRTKVEGRFLHHEGTIKPGDIVDIAFLRGHKGNTVMMLRQVGAGSMSSTGEALELYAHAKFPDGSQIYIPVTNNGDVPQIFAKVNPPHARRRVINYYIYEGQDSDMLKHLPSLDTPNRAASAGFRQIDKSAFLRTAGSDTSLSRLFMKEVSCTEAPGGLALYNYLRYGLRGGNPLLVVPDFITEAILLEKFFNERTSQISSLLSSLETTITSRGASEYLRRRFKAEFTDKTKNRVSLEQYIQTARQQNTNIPAGDLEAQRKLYNNIFLNTGEFGRQVMVPELDAAIRRFGVESSVSPVSAQGNWKDSHLVPIVGSSPGGSLATSIHSPHYLRLLLIAEYLEGSVDGLDLIDIRYQDNKPFNCHELYTILRDASVGLTTIRDKGLVHRDMKPANLLLTTDTESNVQASYILDFGISNQIGRHVSKGPQSFRAGTAAFGTEAYAAPEQFNESAPLSTKMDIYGLGGVLFHFATGQDPISYGISNPITSPDPEQRSHKIRTALEQTQMDRKLIDIVVRMLDWDPDKRPSLEEIYETAEGTLSPLDNYMLFPGYSLREIDDCDSYSCIAKSLREGLIPDHDRVHIFTNLTKEVSNALSQFRREAGTSFDEDTAINGIISEVEIILNQGSIPSIRFNYNSSQIKASATTWIQNTELALSSVALWLRTLRKLQILSAQGKLTGFKDGLVGAMDAIVSGHDGQTHKETYIGLLNHDSFLRSSPPGIVMKYFRLRSQDGTEFIVSSREDLYQVIREPKSYSKMGGIGRDPSKLALVWAEELRRLELRTQATSMTPEGAMRIDLTPTVEQESEPVMALLEGRTTLGRRTELTHTQYMVQEIQERLISLAELLKSTTDPEKKKVYEEYIAVTSRMMFWLIAKDAYPRIQQGIDPNTALHRPNFYRQGKGDHPVDEDLQQSFGWINEVRASFEEVADRALWIKDIINDSIDPYRPMASDYLRLWQKRVNDQLLSNFIHVDQPAVEKKHLRETQISLKRRRYWNHWRRYALHMLGIGPSFQTDRLAKQSKETLQLLTL